MRSTPFNRKGLLNMTVSLSERAIMQSDPLLLFGAGDSAS
jgi:hypothetical protein